MPSLRARQLESIGSLTGERCRSERRFCPTGMRFLAHIAGQVNPFVENWDHICLTDVLGSPIFGKRSTGDRPRQSGDNTRQVTISTEGPTAGDNPWTDLPPP